MTTHTSARRISLAALAATAFAALALTGCASPTELTSAPEAEHSTARSELLRTYGLDGLDAAQIIERLDTMPVAERPAGLIASVGIDELVLSEEQYGEVRLSMPEDQAYISVAPYLQQTHTCSFHSLTTCRGELAGEPMNVTLTSVTGEVLVHEVRETYDNGFIGFWLPRGITATLTVEQDGRTGTTTLSTVNASDPTCVTTLQLT